MKGLPARRDAVAGLAIAGTLVTAAVGLGMVATGALQGPPLGMDPDPRAVCQLTPDFRPDAGCTPGEVMTTDIKLICQAGYSEDVRYVPVALRAKVLASYGLLRPPDPEERVVKFKGHLDHRLALSLGGSNGIKNLAPISAKDNSLKNTVERRVRHELCDEKSITVQEAQRRFLVVDPRWQAADDDLVSAR